MALNRLVFFVEPLKLDQKNFVSLEMQEKKDRIDDALNASRSGDKEASKGQILGAGLALGGFVPDWKPPL